MARKIQGHKFIFMIAFVAFILLGGMSQPAFGQLSAGDIAFTGFNGKGSASDYGFSVVLLSSVSGSQEIQFTSEEWDGSNFTGSGGSITWKAPSGGATAGTVLVFADVGDNPSVSDGSITDGTTMNLSGSGDIIYAFLGPDKDTPETPTTDAFLAAIATGADLYNKPTGTKGTLDGTGLAQAGNETILLPQNIDNAEYIGDRSGNTPSGYRRLLNDVGTKTATDDNWDIHNGGDIAPFPPFNDQPFTIVSAPTIAFTAATVEAPEGSGTADLIVKLLEANGTAVTADVVFSEASSTADLSDIDNYTTKQVSFGSGASSNDTKTVTVTLNDDSNFEGDEKAVFELQNSRSGTVISPGNITLNINDNDAPDIYVNEVHAAPSSSGTDGDAGGNGTRNGSDDEFVEFVNRGTSDIDISNWKFLNEGTLKHIFPEGTVIPANGAFVLFGNDDVKPEGVFGGAVVQSSNESASLSLVNSGDTINLEDDNGNQVISLTYPDAGDEQSIVRAGDAKRGTFINHSTATGAGSALFSPGTKVDGTAFGSASYAISIRGNEGWRMIATPTQNTSFAELFGDFWMQGISGSNDPSGKGTVFFWDETSGGKFKVLASMNTKLKAGKGYIVYAFEDNELNKPGVQGGFPKIVSSNKSENSSSVSISVTANDDDGNSTIDNDEGWNLLGNPYGTDISVDAVLTALENVNSNVNQNVYVYNSKEDKYEKLNSGDTIAPFQAFFVRYTDATGVSGSVNFNRGDLAANTGATFFKNKNKTKYEFSISLQGPEYSDPFYVSFSEKGKVALDRYDAYKLFSLNPDAINLYGVEGTNKLLKNELPENLDEKVEIPLAFDANNRQKLRFKWKGLRSLPTSWQVKLIDRKLNQKVDISKISEYSFTAKTKLNNSSKIDDEPLYQKTESSSNNVRFVLSINPGRMLGKRDQEQPKSVQLNPNYPNPFNPSTTLSYELKKETDVTLTIWNMIGQKVATLVDGVKDAGTHKKTWNASQMPSGIYIARFEVASKVYTRKMTLIK